MIDPIFSTEPMRAIFAPSATLAADADFEAALARAEGAAGVIPAAAATAIAAQCDAANFDVEAIAQRRARRRQPAPFRWWRALTAQVDGVERRRGFVHWGATSQDVIDTGLVLQLRDALALVEADLARLARRARGAGARASRHAAGRAHAAAAGAAGDAGTQARADALRASTVIGAARGRRCASA